MPGACQALSDGSCSFFNAPAALRIQLHSVAMPLHQRLAGTPSNFASSRQLIPDRVLVTEMMLKEPDNLIA